MTKTEAEDLPGVEAQAVAIRCRRALTLLGMGVVAPGSAQVAAGSRRVGLFALLVWLLLGLGVVALVVVFLVRRSLVVQLLTNPTALWVAFGLVIAIGTAWALLLIDTWRIAHPGGLPPLRRVLFSLLAAVLVFAVGGGTFWLASAVRAEIDLLGKVFRGGGAPLPASGRYNILLLGGDAGAGRTGLRPDSITVASVDARTGRTVLIGLPRNLEGVPFPANSPLHSLYPNGYSCRDHSCLLNAVYTLAMEHKDRYPGAANPGVKATTEVVSEITGLQINYFALIDLEGFAALVDAVGGINMDVNRAVPIGGETSPISGYIGPGKNIHLDGYHALWFARSRAGSSDYDRMQRQKCVMAAMLNQLDPVTVATRFTALLGATGRIVETDVPSGEIGTLVELALKVKRLPIAYLSLTPPLVQPGNPDWRAIRTAVSSRIAESEAMDSGASATPGRTVASNPASTVGALPTASGQPTARKSNATISAPIEAQTPQNEVGDLAEVCAAR